MWSCDLGFYPKLEGFCRIRECNSLLYHPDEFSFNPSLKRRETVASREGEMPLSAFLAVNFNNSF
jgi:hypothetical protein